MSLLCVLLAEVRNTYIVIKFTYFNFLRYALPVDDGVRTV